MPAADKAAFAKDGRGGQFLLRPARSPKPWRSANHRHALAGLVQPAGGLDALESKLCKVDCLLAGLHDGDSVAVISSTMLC
jgi:hypothetical protein